jgi:hypothetical protein
MLGAELAARVKRACTVSPMPTGFTKRSVSSPEFASTGPGAGLTNRPAAALSTK